VYVAVGFPENVTCVGCSKQFAGAAPVQLKFTRLTYPPFAVSVPSNVAVCVGKTVCGEFEITFV
jgi:hypothetical protein